MPHMGSGDRIGQCPCPVFPWCQKVLLDGAAYKGRTQDIVQFSSELGDHLWGQVLGGRKRGVGQTLEQGLLRSKEGSRSLVADS